jgi:tRNA-Thr(GGU) m(6)t(6)A37 methyltransferase TsaA
MMSTAGSSLFIALTAVGASAVGFAVRYSRRTIKNLEHKLVQTQNKLDKAILQQTVSNTAAAAVTEPPTFTMTEIGRLHAPFPQRAGCPRQGGALAPHIRSRLVFSPNIPKEMLDGITGYSHVWIVFAFHLNPRGKASSGQKGQVTFSATKIRPPRANGLKVGVLATRAPHRPNPVGLSLGLVEKLETISIKGRKRTCLVIRGLDLVDDTPVYDIKPYVPWDRVDSPEPSPSSSDLSIRMKHMSTPAWVSADDDELPRVEWTEQASDSLHCFSDELIPLYDNASEAMAAMSEIVAQDPRALHDGRGKLSDRDDDFNFTFGPFRVSFRVVQKDDGAVATALVTTLHLDEGDLKSAPGSYPHNLGLRRQAEASARESGRKLTWANPVREGITDDLFDLKGGGRCDYEATRFAKAEHT